MLQGKKTYILAILIGVMSAAKALGWINESIFQTLMGILGASGLATLRSSIVGIDKKLIFIPFIISLLIPSTLFAQTDANTVSKLAWDQDRLGPEPLPLIYKYFADNATVGIQLTEVVCSSTNSADPNAVFACTAKFPAFTPGPHSIYITATNPSNPLGISDKSETLNFTFTVNPATPRNLRIVSINP